MSKAAVYVTDVRTKGRPIELESLKSINVPILDSDLAKAIAANNIANKALAVYYLDLPDTAHGITAYDVVMEGTQL